MKSVDVVLKFGGDALGRADSFRESLRIAREAIQKHEGRVAVVVSALRGVTDLLANGGPDAVDAVKKMYLKMAGELGAPRFCVSIIIRSLNSSIMNRLVPSGVGESGANDFRMSFGELLSAVLFAAMLNKHTGPGTARMVDARELIVTDDNFGEAAVDFEATGRCFELCFADFAAVPVIPGFIGVTARGRTTTLGRNQSDFSGAIVAAMMRVRTLELWKCGVDGVMTADPCIVPGARLVRHLRYNEAFEISGCGARVVASSVMDLARKSGGVVVNIRNVNNLACGGTLISDQPSSDDNMVQTIVAVPGVALVDVKGIALVGVPGMLERAAGALRACGISIKFVAQPISECEITLGVLKSDARAAKQALLEAFLREIDERKIEVEIRSSEFGVLAVIGERMKGVRGITARVTAAVSKVANLAAYTQGDETNISLVVDASELNAAVNAVHDEFFGTKSVALFLIGARDNDHVCNVGGALLRLLKKLNRSDIKLWAIANRSHLLTDAHGLDPANWLASLAASLRPFSIEELLREVSLCYSGEKILVDCSGDSGIARRYKEFAEAGCHIVTPSKHGGVLRISDYGALHEKLADCGLYYGNRATVGAGFILPTLKWLVHQGDRIIKIRAMLSGTLGFTFNAYNGSIALDEILEVARQLGLTEPNPREDLRGADVVRKVVIILRVLGYNVELEDVNGCDMSLWAESEFKARLEAAASRGKVLRYVATIDFDPMRAGAALEEVALSDPLARSMGAENVVMIESEMARNNGHRQAVLYGVGAGSESTAQAVLDDILEIVEK